MYLYVCLCPSWQKDYRAKGLSMRGTREVSQRSGIFIQLKDDIAKTTVALEGKPLLESYESYAQLPLGVIISHAST